MKDISSSSEIKSTWCEFQNYKLSNYDIDNIMVLRSYGDRNTKKIGMSREFVFIGEANQINALEYSWNFLNIYSYIFLSFICLLYGFLASSLKDKRFNPFLHSIIISYSLIGFSHSIDNLLYFLGVSHEMLLSSVRYSYLFSVIYSIFQINNTKRKSILYILGGVFALSSFPTIYSDFILHGAYRWLVLACSLSLFFVSLKNKNFIASLLSIYFVWDSFVIFNILKLSSGVYLSPISLGFLFLAINYKKVNKIIRNNISWIKKEDLKNQLREIETNDLPFDELRELLTKVICNLMYNVNSSRASICFFNDGKPVIINVCDGKISTFNDGVIPEVFGKVIQSGDPIWWADDSTFSSFKKVPEDKHFGVSSIAPIKVSSKVFGAVSLTNFKFSKEELKGEVSSIESTIDSYIDLIIRYLIYNENQNKLQMKNLRSELNNKVSSSLIDIKDKKNAYQSYCDIISEKLDVVTLIFTFSEKDRGLDLVGFSGENNIIRDEWSKIPFKARLDNKISPFAVSVNEVKPIYVSNIESYYSILKSKHSKKLFELTKTKGFFCTPVVVDEKVDSLIVVLEKKVSKCFSNDIMDTLNVSLSYLSFKLKEIDIIELESKKDNLLNQFVPENAKNRILQEGNAYEDDYGTLVMIDLRSSTKISNISSKYADKFVDCVETVRAKIEPVASSYGFVLQKINWDAFYFTHSYDDGVTINIENINKFVTFTHQVCYEAYKSHFNDLVISPHHTGADCCRIVFAEGDISRSMINIGSTNSWGIHGTIMAVICKLEDACKKLDGFYFTLGSVVEKNKLLGWVNTGKKVDSTDEYIFEFKSTDKKHNEVS